MDDVSRPMRLLMPPARNRWCREIGRPGVSAPLRQALATWLGETGAEDARRRMPATTLVACGPRGCGKSSFLRSTGLELARLASPDRLRVAGIDPGGRELAVLEALPHMHLELATSTRHAESILAWLADEAAWRLEHGVSRPALVLLMEMWEGATPSDCESAWHRLRQALTHGLQVGLFAVLAWKGIPFGAGWREWFGDDPRVELALPASQERPAREWQVQMGGKSLRVCVPWFGVMDLDAATREIGRERHVWGERVPNGSVGHGVGGLE